MTMQAELSDVIYNAADQAFEAVVTIQSTSGPLRYAASFPAPITTDFDAASEGLIERANRMHRLNRGMRAAARKVVLPAQWRPRNGRPAPSRWIESLLGRARAA